MECGRVRTTTNNRLENPLPEPSLIQQLALRIELQVLAIIRTSKISERKNIDYEKNKNIITFSKSSENEENILFTVNDLITVCILAIINVQEAAKQPILTTSNSSQKIDWNPSTISKEDLPLTTWIERCLNHIAYLRSLTQSQRIDQLQKEDPSLLESNVAAFASATPEVGCNTQPYRIDRFKSIGDTFCKWHASDVAKNKNHLLNINDVYLRKWMLDQIGLFINKRFELNNIFDLVANVDNTSSNTYQTNSPNFKALLPLCQELSLLPDEGEATLALTKKIAKSYLSIYNESIDNLIKILQSHDSEKVKSNYSKKDFKQLKWMWYQNWKWAIYKVVKLLATLQSDRYSQRQITILQQILKSMDNIVELQQKQLGLIITPASDLKMLAQQQKVALEMKKQKKLARFGLTPNWVQVANEQLEEQNRRREKLSFPTVAPSKYKKITKQLQLQSLPNDVAPLKFRQIAQQQTGTSPRSTSFTHDLTHSNNSEVPQKTRAFTVPTKNTCKIEKKESNDN